MATENISLNFVNRSNDANNSDIVIFQQNVAEDFGELAIAWQVIKNCGRGDNHPFSFPLAFQVAAEDSYGNYTPPMTAAAGDAYEMVRDNSGDILRLAATGAVSPQHVEVRNALNAGSIAACCYRDGRLLARKPDLAPGQKAVFQFDPGLYIGALSQITQGQAMTSQIIAQINTRLALDGIVSADIVMTGGGAGSKAPGLEFRLQDVVR